MITTNNNLQNVFLLLSSLASIEITLWARKIIKERSQSSYLW